MYSGRLFGTYIRITHIHGIKGYLDAFTINNNGKFGDTEF